VRTGIRHVFNRDPNPHGLGLRHPRWIDQRWLHHRRRRAFGRLPKWGRVVLVHVSTCTSQRSYALDTVVSVHGGETIQDRCPGKKINQIIGNDDWDLGLTQACELFGDPKNVDSALPLGGSYALAPGETVVIRVSHHDDSFENNFTLNVLPEPEAWLALVVGAGALSALSRRRARG